MNISIGKYYMTKTVMTFGDDFKIFIGSKIRLISILSTRDVYLIEYNTISYNEMCENAYGLLEHRKSVISNYYASR